MLSAPKGEGEVGRNLLQYGSVRNAKEEERWLQLIAAQVVDGVRGELTG